MRINEIEMTPTNETLQFIKSGMRPPYPENLPDNDPAVLRFLNYWRYVINEACRKNSETVARVMKRYE